MIRVLDQGESVATSVTARLDSDVENSRELAYRLYHVCGRKGYVQEAQDHNALVQSWPEISRLAKGVVSAPTPEGMRMHDDR